MAAIKCKDCGFMISDPCALLNNLFSARLMSERQDFLNTNPIDTKKRITERLEKELGLTDVEERYERFKDRVHGQNFLDQHETVIFTLRCLAGHLNHYVINCN